MDEKYKGIIIKLNDINDADKLASIFTLEQGVITAKFTGVKRDKAKFKSVAMMFSVADFVFNKKGNFRTVTSADLIDNFPNILLDYNKTMCAYIIADILNSILPKEKPEQELFLLTLTTMNDLENTTAFVSTIEFIIKFLEINGDYLELPNCQYAYIDHMTGNIVREKTIDCAQLDKKVYNTLFAIINKKEFDYNETVLKQILRLLHNILYLKYNVDIKSFSFI